MCVVKLETCPMRAINAAIVASRAVTRQCERIIEIYSVLIFPLVALLHRSLYERSLKLRAQDVAMPPSHKSHVGVSHVSNGINHAGKNFPGVYFCCNA